MGTTSVVRGAGMGDVAGSKPRPEMVVPSVTRLASVDLLRGSVMVLMALDHVRALLGTSGWDPTFSSAGAATFLTRWITHFCAPVFVLLAGVAAALSLGRGRSKDELARFLFTRGLWLAALDVTLVSFAWFFRIGSPLVTDVMWVIGWSMVVLAVLVRLPVPVLAIFVVVLVGGHNALDGVHATALGRAGPLWIVLHEQGLIRLPWGQTWFVGYPLVPWVGVMALGYVLGILVMAEPASRRRRLVLLGAGMIAAFVALRASNLYGDPLPWSQGAAPLMTAFSFISCNKYPPSLLYLLMTLGPALLALAALDRARPSARNPILVFGVVPLFYYVLHLYIIHLAAGLAFLPRLGTAAFHVDPESPPAGFGLPLGGVYLVWLATLAAMYPLCRWFAGVKRRGQGIWLSYL